MTEWIEIPRGLYRVGLEPHEARQLAERWQAWAEANVEGPSLAGLDLPLSTEQLEEILVREHPAIDTDLAPFAIGARTVTNGEFERFMEATGEPERPSRWKPDAADLPAVGVPFVVASAFAEWAGARLPFEDEWERLMRGPERRLQATACEPAEWCADITERWRRVLRGGPSNGLPGVFRREAGNPCTYGHLSAGFRLVRADGRRMPSMPSTTSYSALGVLEARAFQTTRLRRAFAALRTSCISLDHAIVEDAFGGFSDLPAAWPLIRAVRRDPSMGCIYDGAERRKWGWGAFFLAVSKESNPRIFVWNIQYRHDERGHLRARPVVLFRMAFDREVQRFENRFRENEPDTALAEVTEDLVQRSILDAYRYYDNPIT